MPITLTVTRMIKKEVGNEDDDDEEDEYKNCNEDHANDKNDNVADRGEDENYDRSGQGHAED